MAPADRIPIPAPRPTRTWVRWAGGTLVALIGASAYFLVTSDSTLDRSFAAGLIVVAVVATAYLGSARMWVEPATGAVVWERLGVRRRRLVLAEVREARLITNHGGGLVLALRRQGRRRRYFVTVLNFTVYGDVSLPAEALRMWAGHLERWTPGVDTVVGQLREQAVYVATGADLRRSPLASLVPRVARAT